MCYDFVCLYCTLKIYLFFVIRQPLFPSQPVPVNLSVAAPRVPQRDRGPLVACAQKENRALDSAFHSCQWAIQSSLALTKQI